MSAGYTLKLNLKSPTENNYEFHSIEKKVKGI